MLTPESIEWEAINIKWVVKNRLDFRLQQGEIDFIFKSTDLNVEREM